jgi:hypothetical protein
MHEATLTKAQSSRGMPSAQIPKYPSTQAPKPASDGLTATTVTCDRCRKIVQGFRGHGCTSGFYERDGHPSTGWGRFMNDGENRLCDACMHADPRYLALYGVKIKSA